VRGGLDAEDSVFAAEVRKAIFTFGHLPRRLKAMDVPKVLRAIEARTTALALAAAQRGKEDEVAAVDFVLASLPQRLAQSIQDEMATFERIKPVEAEAAQTAILNAVRDRAASGEIELVEEEDGTEAGPRS
jgi:flagellar motor switch protein FliG